MRLRVEARLHEGSPEFEEQREYIRQWLSGGQRGSSTTTGMSRSPARRW